MSFGLGFNTMNNSDMYEIVMKDNVLQLKQ